jgi:hypothetical protein
MGEDKPKIVVICGSSRWVDIMAVCAWLIERDEQAIVMSLHLLPAWYPDCPADHLAEHEGCARAMDELHLRKIDLADEVFVVNHEEYVGESTAREVGYATKRPNVKRIRLYSQDPVGEKVREMLGEAAKKGITMTDEDLLAGFLEAHCEVGEQLESRASVLFDKFSEWHEENISKKGIDRKKFDTILRQHFRKFKFDGHYVYKGLALKKTLESFIQNQEEPDVVDFNYYRKDERRAIARPSPSPGWPLG